MLPKTFTILLAVGLYHVPNLSNCFEDWQNLVDPEKTFFEIFLELNDDQKKSIFEIAEELFDDRQSRIISDIKNIENSFDMLPEKYEGGEEDGRKINVTIPDRIKNETAPCKLCMGFIAGLKYVQRNKTQGEIVNASIKICKIIFRKKYNVDYFCPGTVNTYAPHILKIVAPIKVLPKKMCTYLNVCISPKSRPKPNVTDNDNDGIELRKPVVEEIKKISEKVGQKSKNSVLKIVQLTDIHIEKRYKEGTKTDCGLPVCCIERWGEGSAGLFGDYNCNIPHKTFENFLEKVKGHNPDVILFTGDVSPHTVWEETYESQMQCTKDTVDLLKKHLGGRNVYPVIGNHETYPTNLFSVLNLPETTKFLTHFHDSWATLAGFTKDDRTNIMNGGFYSKLVHPKLKFISFNGIYMYTHNYYNVLNHESILMAPEIKKMKKFLEDEMKDARKKGLKVILASHNPYGTSDFIISQSEYMEDLIRRYFDVIVLMPTGHTHYDEFRVIYSDDSGKIPISVQLVSPAVSTSNVKNPSMRIYYVDGLTYELLDYEQYFLNMMSLKDLTAADVPNYNISNHIQLLYRAKSEYNMADLSPASFHDLVERLNHDPALLLNYVNRYTALAQNYTRVSPLQKRHHICRLKNVHYDSYTRCFSQKPWLPPREDWPIALTKRPALKEPVINFAAGGGWRGVAWWWWWWSMVVVLGWGWVW